MIALPVLSVSGALWPNTLIIEQTFDSDNFRLLYAAKILMSPRQNWTFDFIYVNEGVCERVIYTSRSSAISKI